MTRSLNQTGRRVVLAGLAALVAMAATLGLASGAQAAMVYASTKQVAGDFTTDFEIWKASDSGGSLVRLTNNTYWDERPSLSTDGSKVVFASKRDNNWDIYKMTSSGTVEVRLTTGVANDTRPVWSPDGTQIAWARQEGNNWDIWTMNQDGTGQTRLTTNAATDTAPAWNSTSGIAFVSNRVNGAPSGFDVYKMSATGTSETRLTTHSGDEFDPSWYDSDEVLYTRNLPQGAGIQRDIYQVDAGGGGQGVTASVTNTTTRDECDAVRRDDSSSVVFTNLSVGIADIWDAGHSGSSPDPFGSLSTATTNDQQVAFQGQ